MTPQEALVVLNCLYIGPVRVQNLLQRFETATAVLGASRRALAAVKGVTDAAAESIARWRDTVDLEGELGTVNDLGLRLITILDADYPPNLKQIHDPPIVLHAKGDLKPQDRWAIAVVGTRRASHYGRECATRLARDLAARGITVVSGLARGIDTAAHRGALAAKGRTIAVMGSGFLKPYPPEHADFIDEIASNGAVLSEFPLKTPPDTMTFPVRNRTMSGLCLGVVVVEASRESGAMITAGHALEQNRSVFAVPGRIDLKSFRGNHHLLKQGAKLVEEVDDVLSEFEYLFPKAEVAAEALRAADRPRPNLDDKEHQVLSCLSREEKDIDMIIADSGLSPGEVSVVLLSLEMKKLVKQLPGKLFITTDVFA